MARLTISVLISLLALSNGASFNSRVINGQRAASPDQFPWHVNLRIFEPSQVVHICGGSIISPNFILTAGHCVKLGYKFEVHAGSIHRLSQPVVVTATKSHVHEKYDVAVIELDNALEFSSNVAAVSLPPLSMAQRDLSGKLATVTGYGYYSDQEDKLSPNLLYVPQRILPFAECKRIYGSNVSEEDMCTDTQGHNVCYGDSGGPLVFTDDTGETFQIGVVSFGADRGCSAGYPSGFVQTLHVLEFIARETDVRIRVV